VYARSRLNSVWSRLLAMLALVVVPAALLTLLLAWSLFGSALANLEVTQASAAVGRADALRAWLDAAGRSLANESAAALLLPSERCNELARAFLNNNPGFASLRLAHEGDAPCEAGVPLPAPPSSSEVSKETGYGLAAISGRLWVLAGAENSPSVLLVDDAALRARLYVIASLGETHMALMGPHNETWAQDSAAVDTGWLPADQDFTTRQTTFRGADRNGAAASFGLAPVGSAFHLLVRFDDRVYEAARRRFVVLCLAQLAMLGLFAYVYAVAIRRDVVRWIEGIDLAARMRGDDPHSRAAAPVSDKMPRELRNVAVSFNAMADHALERQRALEASLIENRTLMLEMHHRIKNSLQVIQSYLALIRRNGPRAEAPLLARIEARVGVLAVAYRLALTPNGIRPISVKPFLEEIFAAAIGGLRRPRQRATCQLDWDGDLIIDRAIPLGLALAEALIVALNPTDVANVGVRLTIDAAGEIELWVEADAAPSAPGLPDKVMRGLAAQLGATPAPFSPRVILHWRFVP